MAESIGVMPALHQAMAVDGVNLMSSTAGAMMRSELESMYSTKYILSPSEQAEIQVLCGYPVRPLNKKPKPSCHWQIAVLRDMLRKTYTSEARPETTRLKTLVVASAEREISLYWKNPNVDYYVYGKESKDGRRVVMKILESLRDEVAKRAMLTEDIGGVEIPKTKRRAVLNLKSIEEMLAAYQAAKDDHIEGQRIFTRIPEGRKYDQILVEDGHYNFREADWLKLFHATGASQAWVIGMLPYELLFDGAPESSIYKIREQRKPGVGTWDAVLAAAFTAMELSNLGRDGMGWIGSVLCGGLFYLVRDVKKRRYDIFVRDGLRYFSQFENFSKTLGISSWRTRVTAALQKIWEAWSDKLGSTELIMTYQGHSNGYIHDRDAMMTLLERPWMGSVEYNFSLISEVFQRLGPMSVVHIGRADLRERVARSLCLGRTEKYVRVLDLFASYDFLNDVPKEPVYFPMRQHEYFDVVDFLSSQKPMSINVQTAMIMVRRASAGLSLGKTQLTPPWRCGQEMLYRVAANAALVSLERAEAAEKISDKAFKELVTGEEPRWAHYAKVVLAVGGCLATAGLAIPIFGMYFWLTKRKVKYPLYEMGQDEVFQEDGAPGWAEYAEVYGKGNSFSFDVEVPIVSRDDRPTIEAECDFIQLLGDMGKQDPVCMHARGQCGKRTDLSMTESDMAELRAHLVQGRDSSPNDGIAKTIDGLIDLMNADRNGFSFDARVELVRGPPGVGKSYTMRALMKRMVDSGRAVGVYSPFGKLSVDYSVANEALGQPSFPFFTTHKFYKVGKVNLMVAEEYTNLDERLIAYMAYKSGAQVVVMVGDETQTGLMPTEGERPFRSGGVLRLEEVREHILPVNFRSDAYTVALLNEECGYCLYAENEDVVLPEIRPVDELDIHETSVMTFSKATAHQAQQPVGEENTVRKNQGQTHTEGTAILLRDGDEQLVKNNALFGVAVSRRKVGTGLVVYADTSEVEALMRARLRLDDPEFLANIPKLSRPDYRAYYERIRAERFGPDVEEKEGEFAGLLKSEGCWREDVDQGSAEWAVEFFRGMWDSYAAKVKAPVQQLPTYREEPKELKGDEVPLKQPADKEWCTLDAMVQYRVRKRRSAPYSNLLRNAYIRDVVAGVSGKRVPINFLLEWLRRHSIRHLIFDTRDGSYQGDWNGDIDYDSAGYAKPLYLVQYNGHHVDAMTRAQVAAIVKRRQVKISNGGLNGLADYCDFWTVQDFEIWNNVTLKGGIPRGIRMGELFRMTDLVAVAPLPGGSTGIEIRVEMHQDTAGGIGVFGPDEVVRDSDRVSFRNALAVAMADEHDYSYGGTAFIEKGDRFPERVVREREVAGGADGWLLASEVDVTFGSGLRTNAVGAAMGSSRLLEKMRVARDPLYVRMDKKGRVLPDSDFVNAFSMGYGNTQTDSTVETLGAADRYFVKPRGVRESVEGRKHAVDIANRLYLETFDRENEIGVDGVDGIQRQFESDALNRSYDARALGLFERFVPDRQVTFANKVQFKWGRKQTPTAKEAKVGQGISATSSAINLRYGGLMRQADHVYATSAKAWNVFDCYMTRQELVDRVNAETDRLPSCTSLVTTDAEEFDSAQNWHSARAETRLNTLLVGFPDDFEQYVDEVRTNYPVSAPGLFSGKVVQAKPSGAPDTLGGNTRVSDLYTHYLVEGRGPQVVLKKGDDKMMNRYGQRINRDRARKLACYSPLKLTVSEGDNQFCGLSATSQGLFENFVGMVRKALARGSRDYRSWAEYQVSLRDTLKEVHRVGLMATIAATASAMDVSVEYVWSCYTVVQSLCHISEDQWLSTVNEVERNYPAPRTAGFIPRPWGA